MMKRKQLCKRPAPEGAATKYAKREKNDRKKDCNAMWIYGIHAALGAVANPRRRCLRIVLASSERPAEVASSLASRLAAAVNACEAFRPPVETLSQRELENLLPEDAVHQGIAVLCAPLPSPALNDVLASVKETGQAAVVLVLDQATDPRNIGSVLRSAAAFGALAVIVQDRHSPPVTPAMAKAAAGALEITPLIRVANIASALEILKEHGFWCAGMEAKASQTIAQANLSGKVALVLGSEGLGLRRLTSASCDLLVRAPITGAVESLNLSNAAAIALYELRRAP